MKTRKAIGVISTCEDCPNVRKYTNTQCRVGMIFICGLTGAILTPVLNIDSTDPSQLVGGIDIPENCPLETV